MSDALKWASLHQQHIWLYPPSATSHLVSAAWSQSFSVVPMASDCVVIHAARELNLQQLA